MPWSKVAKKDNRELKTLLQHCLEMAVTLFRHCFVAGVSSRRSVMSVGNASEHTTLLHDVAESFALDPVDASAIRGQVHRDHSYHRNLSINIE
jgi:hypothetical protein